MRQIHLDRVEYVRKVLVERTGCELRYDDLRAEFVFKTCTQLLAQKALFRREFTCSYPASWWQHFKQRWFPEWLLRRFPVELETKRFVAMAEARALFPELHAAERYWTIAYLVEGNE